MGQWDKMASQLPRLIIWVQFWKHTCYKEKNKSHKWFSDLYPISHIYTHTYPAHAHAHHKYHTNSMS